MEKFRTCPICLEVPEQEIFQCRVGHVICNLCIVKVNGGLCPHCRLPYGTVRIRNRLFEEMLDSQEFDCKFQERGCAHICKRGEITTHSNSCLYNPDTNSVCEQLGLDNCNFRLGCISRAEVIAHFEQAHNCSLKILPKLSMSFNGKMFLDTNDRKRKAGAQRVTKPLFLYVIASQEPTQCNPLFLIFGKLKHSTGYLSLYCIKAWESLSCPCRSLNAIFSLVRDNASSSSTTSSSTSASSSSCLTANKYNPFPFFGSMKVGGIKDVPSLLKASTINFPISLLDDHRFGVGNDSIHVRITPLPLQVAASIAGALLGSGVAQGGVIVSSSSTSSVTL